MLSRGCTGASELHSDICVSTVCWQCALSDCLGLTENKKGLAVWKVPILSVRTVICTAESCLLLKDSVE